MVGAVSDRMLDEMAAAGLDEVRELVALLEKRYDHAALHAPSSPSALAAVGTVKPNGTC
jgi:hypothetical protein